MLPIRIDFNNECNGRYPKEPGVPCFCIGEGGENILQITKPSIAVVPLFDVHKEGYSPAIEPSTEEMLRSALSQHLIALAALAPSGYQIIVRVKTVDTDFKPAAEGGTLFTVKAYVGVIALIPRTEPQTVAPPSMVEQTQPSGPPKVEANPLPTNEQPLPVATDEQPVWEMVIEDMKARDQLGRERYGMPLTANNGRDALRDAYEESLDLAVYLRQEIERRKSMGTPSQHTQKQ